MSKGEGSVQVGVVFAVGDRALVAGGSGGLFDSLGYFYIDH